MNATGFLFLLVFVVMSGSISYTMVEIRNEIREMNKILANNKNGGTNGL